MRIFRRFARFRWPGLRTQRVLPPLGGFPGTTPDHLLLESGDAMLLESGDYLLLEAV